MQSDSNAVDENLRPLQPPVNTTEGESASRRATREKLIQRHPALFERSRALASIKNELCTSINTDNISWSSGEDAVAKLEKKLVKLEGDLSEAKSESDALNIYIKDLEQDKHRLLFDNEQLKDALLDAEKNLQSAQLDIEILKEQRESWQENLIASVDHEQRETLNEKQISSKLVDTVNRLAKHTLQMQRQNSALNQELEFERGQLHELKNRWNELKSAMKQHQCKMKTEDRGPELELHRLNAQIELSNDQIQYLEALASTQAEIELGHVELATELQTELDEKDGEISVLYRTLRTLQKHMHRLYVEAQRSRELIGILQRENIDLHHAMQRLEDRQNELRNQSQEKSNRNMHLIRLLRQTQRTQIEHHLRQLQCIQLEHQLKIAEMRIPPLFIQPEEAASTNALLCLHRIMFKSRLILGQFDEKLSGSEMTPEFHLACHCARLCANLQSLAHQALAVLSNIDIDAYLRVGTYSGDLLACEVACDKSLQILADDMLTIDFDIASLRSSNDTLTMLVTELQPQACSIGACEQIVQSTLARVYFQQLEQSAFWEEFRTKIANPLCTDDDVWRITVTTTLDNMFSAYNRALSTSRVAFHEADSRAGLLLNYEESFFSVVSELNSLSDQANDAVKSMCAKVDTTVDSSHADEISALFRESHDEITRSFGRIAHILSEIVMKVTKAVRTDLGFDLYKLQFHSPVNKNANAPPWELYAAEIKNQLQDTDKIRMTLQCLQSEMDENEARYAALSRDLEFERLRSEAFCQKLEILKTRELQYQETIQELRIARNPSPELPKPLVSPLSAILSSEHNRSMEADSSILRLRQIIQTLRYRLNLSRCGCRPKLVQRVKKKLPSLRVLPNKSNSSEPETEILPLSGNLLHLLSTPMLVSIAPSSEHNLAASYEHNLVRDQHYRQCLRLRLELQERKKNVSLSHDSSPWIEHYQTLPFPVSV